jgi:hypothetical protein
MAALYEELLKDLLHYFRYVQETLLIAFGNSGKPLEVKSDKNNPKVLALVSATRVFSVAKTSMDQALRGYPIVAMAMSRFLSELVQSCQYLVRHPGLIDGYFSDQLKLGRVLKMAREEGGDPEVFGQFWGLQSRYSHASPDFLSLGLDIKDNRMSSSLIINNPQLIRDVAYVILGSMFLQYLIYRLVLKGDLEVEDELAQRDEFIFDPKNVRTFLGLSELSDDFLDEAYAWIVPIGEA